LTKVKKEKETKSKRESRFSLFLKKRKANKIAKAWYTYIAKYKNNQFKMTDSIQR